MIESTEALSELALRIGLVPCLELQTHELAGEETARGSAHGLNPFSRPITANTIDPEHQRVVSRATASMIAVAGAFLVDTDHII